jgi:antitoxin ParD1/3/4
MNISLTPDLTRLIKEKIASGQYQSASEVVRDALRRLAASERPRSERIAELRRKIAEGLTSSEAGRMVDGATAIKRLQTQLKKSEKARRSR